MLIPNHNHIASVYVRCQVCLTFGTPMPHETQETDFPVKCGNCGSTETVTYYPKCCLKVACGEAYGNGYQAGGNDVLNGNADIEYTDEKISPLDEFDDDFDEFDDDFEEFDDDEFI